MRKYLETRKHLNELKISDLVVLIVNFFGNPLSGFILKDNNNEPQIDFDPLNKTATVSFVNVGHAWASMQRRKGAGDALQPKGAKVQRCG